MSDLMEAVEMHNRRKAAVADGLGILEEQRGRGGLHDGEGDGFRSVHSDLDLDETELAALCAHIMSEVLGALNRGVPLGHVVPGLWMDGLVTGLLLARIRAEAADG